jgi:hypothetical protein
MFVCDIAATEKAIGDADVNRNRVDVDGEPDGNATGSAALFHEPDDASARA